MDKFYRIEISYSIKIIHKIKAFIFMTHMTLFKSYDNQLKNEIKRESKLN